MRKDPTPEQWDTLEPTKYDPPFDPVNKPLHYNSNGVECIDYIQQQLGDQFGAYCLGNTIKYLHRHQYKNNPREDLLKAQWYLNKLLEVTN